MNLTVIQVYAPTADCDDSEINHFYSMLNDTMKQVPKKDILMIMGDWNAKVGSDNSGYEDIMGRYGYGERNDRGDMLLEFAADNDLYICNTRFQQKDSRKWTWRSPNNRTKNMIDLILIRKRWKTAIWNCRTYQGADIASDHSLVMCRFRTRLKVNVSNRAQARLDIERTARPRYKEDFSSFLGCNP